MVVFWHGFFDSADGALCAADKSIAFTLAESGFDVWLPNSRGNKYSRDHRYMDTTNPKFWDFSFDEMAKYDLPATIEFILKTTGQ